jgi:type II secretory pathway pseudopilin PulG
MVDLHERGGPRRASRPCARRRDSDDGFTLIEVSVAGILAIAFIVAASAAFGSVFRVSRANELRQRATAVVGEQLEYVRSLTWTEVRMASVDTDAPMLTDARTALVGSEAGFTGNEVLTVSTAGAVTPFESYELDGTEYEVWRYVTNGPAGTRRFVVRVEWSDDGRDEALVSGTLVSEVTARANETTTTTTTVIGSSTTTSVPG